MKRYIIYEMSHMLEKIYLFYSWNTPASSGIKDNFVQMEQMGKDCKMEMLGKIKGRYEIYVT